MNTSNISSSGLPTVTSTAADGTLPNDVPGAGLAQTPAGEGGAQPEAVRVDSTDAGSEMHAPDPAQPSYAGLIVVIRHQLALSQEDLARQLGVSFATVNRWEKGHTKPSRLARAQLNSFCEQMIGRGKLVLREEQRP